MSVLLAGLVGFVVGSFLNVVVHRVLPSKSVVWPGFHCPGCCGAKIWARDNVPLLSYVLLGDAARIAASVYP